MDKPLEFVATYRLQLREGVGLDAAAALLPRLKDLGVSHLYLSPLFRAASGSTHGYDVIDPDCVDPVLGGEDAFVALSEAARAAGIGIVLDIVPNHMGFTPENPYIADIMRHGRDSRYAAVFDIDWERGPLHFPILDGTVEDVLAAGQIEAATAGAGPVLRIYGLDYPLRDTPLAQREGNSGRLDAATLGQLLAEQHWTVGDWRATANAIIHRRFFNITSLIGVLQEDPAVFDLTHRWIIEQVRAGRVQGLRVDHVDGLAQPGGYLERLRAAAGDVPVWIEKIAKEGEQIPAAWPIEGMSGYEFMTAVTRVLTHGAGLSAMRQAALGAVPQDTGAEVLEVRQHLLRTALEPELQRVTRAACKALGNSSDEAAVASAVERLACAWPVYRSYTADGAPLDPHFAALATHAPDRDLVTLFEAAHDDEKARHFAARFEQLTGALTAKSEEDTVFFRAVGYLPFCEVGAEPDLDRLDAAAFESLMKQRAASSPLALNALSTHDTKRSADARAVMMALSWFPDLAGRFVGSARDIARDAGVPERWGVYGLQIALAMRGQDDAQARVADHVAKAMREAKDLSTHEAPDEGMERKVAEVTLELMRWLGSPDTWPDDTRARFDQVFERLVLAQVALQITAPGMPDIYQGTEFEAVSLTDPDNRRAVDWAADREAGSLSGRKLELTRRLLALRRDNPEVFTQGDYRLEASPGRWSVTRSLGDVSIAIAIDVPDRDCVSIGIG